MLNEGEAATKLGIVFLNPEFNKLACKFIVKPNLLAEYYQFILSWYLQIIKI